MFEYEIAGFIVAFRLAITLLIQPPWRAVYLLWSNFAAFSYGDRLLEWFPYAIASSLFGIGYLAIGVLLIWLGVLGTSRNKKTAPNSGDVTSNRTTPLSLFCGILLFLGILADLIGAAAFASGFVSGTVAFINGTARFFAK